MFRLFKFLLPLALLVPGTVLADVFLLDQTDLVKTRWPGVYAVPTLTFPQPAPPGPAIAPKIKTDAANLLRSLVARGQSQGFQGILYENRDRGHSTMPDIYRNLTRVRYGPVLSKSKADYGVALQVLINPPLIGNSSTAYSAGYRARSLTRYAMTLTMGPNLSFLQTASNSLYIYPEHRDHDAHDLYPANWLYSLNSQGSSGSDREFIDAMLMTLAAFPANTRAFLIQKGLLVNTLQLIMRRNLVGVESENDFMSAKAHPMAFDGERLRPARMVSQAATFDYKNVPPFVQLTMVDENFRNGVGLAQQSEHLFTTPGAIARLWRSPEWQREFVVDAGNTQDPNGHDLKFFWRVLSGDERKITIEPLDATGTRARITMQWHDMYPAQGWKKPGDPPRMMSRVDIGVFAYNGAMLSAPSFVSVSFPAHQKREYGPLPDGSIGLLSVDYDAKSRKTPYDPVLYWSAAWQDKLHYNDQGELTGWTRTSRRGTQEFASDGNLADGTRIVHSFADWTNRAPDLLFNEAEDQ